VRILIALTLSVLAGCGSQSSIGLVIPAGNRASLTIDTAGGRLDLRNAGPGSVAVSGSQELGKLPSAELGAGSSVTWSLQGDTTIEIRNTSDRQADVRVNAFRAHGIEVNQRPVPSR
jgi:hypothetical protein